MATKSPIIRDVYIVIAEFDMLKASEQLKIAWKKLLGHFSLKVTENQCTSNINFVALRRRNIFFLCKTTNSIYVNYQGHAMKVRHKSESWRSCMVFQWRCCFG